MHQTKSSLLWMRSCSCYLGGKGKGKISDCQGCPRGTVKKEKKRNNNMAIATVEAMPAF